MNILRILGARTSISLARILTSSSKKAPPEVKNVQRYAWYKRGRWMLREYTAMFMGKFDILGKVACVGKFHVNMNRFESHMGTVSDKMTNLLKKYICIGSEMFGRKDIVETLDIFPTLEEIRLLADTEDEFLTDEEFERWNAFLEAQEKNGVSKGTAQRELLQMIYIDLCRSKKDGDGQERSKNLQTKARNLDLPHLKRLASINPENLMKAPLREKTKFLKDSIETLRVLYPTTSKSFDEMHLIIQAVEQVIGVLDLIQSSVFNDRQHDFVSFIHIDEMVKQEDESMSAEEIGLWKLVNKSLEKCSSSVDEFHKGVIEMVLYLHGVLSEVSNSE